MLYVEIQKKHDFPSHRASKRYILGLDIVKLRYAKHVLCFGIAKSNSCILFFFFSLMKIQKSSWSHLKNLLKMQILKKFVSLQ